MTERSSSHYSGEASCNDSAGGTYLPECHYWYVVNFRSSCFHIDKPWATHSFMSSRFSILADVPSLPLPGEWQVSLPSGDVMKIDWVFRGCEVLVESLSFEVD